MAQAIVAEVEQVLWEELFWVTKPEERFAVKLEQLVNGVILEGRGVSFVQHRDELEWMLIRVV
jgi:hypothetical protein